MITLTIEHLQVSDLPPEWAQRLNVSPEQTVTVQIDTEEDQEPTQPKFSSGSNKELYLWSPRQTATVEMSLGELIAWEKKYAGQYSEIRLVE